MIGPLGLYVHWPYCLSKCPYCDFNAHVAEAAIEPQRWIAAYRAELTALVERFGARPLNSLFFGGGTPSLMPPEVTEAVIAMARELCGFSNSVEISLEANPGTVDQARFEAFCAVGINRLSLGVQSLDDQALTFFERSHDASQARAAIALAMSQFDNVSIDLIYARPGQSPADWQAELAEALGFGLNHLSLYQLTIEPGTRFEADVRRGLFTPVEDGDQQAELWDIAQRETAMQGFSHYEVSNFSQPGFECAHNLIYWRGQDYFGIGPGAHGRVTNAEGTRAFRSHRMPSIWLERLERDGNAWSGDNLQSPQDRAFERLMMGLRIPEGVALTEVDRYIDPSALAQVVDAGYATVGDRLALTDEGQLRLNSLFTHIWRGAKENHDIRL